MPTEINAERDAEGYLVNPEDWNPNLAHAFAAEENIVLTDAYWVVLNFVRDSWEENQITPDIRHVTDFMAKQQGIDKKAAKQQLFQLFPYGYVKQTCKIAGMQRPRGWSTG